jgi:hypothetical protein
VSQLSNPIVREKLFGESLGAYELRCKLLNIVNAVSKDPTIRAAIRGQITDLLEEYRLYSTAFQYAHMRQTISAVVFLDLEGAKQAGREAIALAEDVPGKAGKAAKRMALLNLANSYWECGDLTMAKELVCEARAIDASPGVLLASVALQMELRQWTPADHRDFNVLALNTPKLVEFALNHPTYPLGRYADCLPFSAFLGARRKQVRGPLSVSPA